MSALAGRLRQLMTLQQENRTDDGTGGYIRNWTDLADLWAELKHEKLLREDAPVPA